MMKCDDKVSNSAHSRQFSWYPQLPACTCSMASGFSQIPKWESDATSHSTIVNPVTVSHDRPGHSQKIQATVWKITQDHI